MAKLKDLAPNLKNPRTISEEKVWMLKKAIAEFGDLSGIVYNRKSKQLVCGHQRSKVLDPESDITITKKYTTPTKTGTVAEGYFISDGEKQSYREVSWDAAREKAANIAANKGAGSWDIPQLTEWIKELSSFDLDFDINLTMFNDSEIKSVTGLLVGEHSLLGADGEDEDEVPEVKEPKAKTGDIYQLGNHRLMCGDSTSINAVDKPCGNIEIDVIIARWEKYTGQTAKLLNPKNKVVLKKASTMPSERHA